MKRYSAFGGEFEAAPIKDFGFDPERSERSVTLDDGNVFPRPRVHGFQPQIGDYFVRALPVQTPRKLGADYVEPGETYIIGRKVFAQHYTPIE